MTQTKGLIGEDEDDLFGPGMDRDFTGHGFGIEHNFKSQTLQFQTNLGSDFINLFAASEHGFAKDEDFDDESCDDNEFGL